MKITYPKSFWNIAEQIGTARSVVNTKIKENSPRFDRGVKNKHVDTLGILGELIVIDYLTEKNITFEMAQLIDFYPTKNPDLIIKNKRIDIKTNKDSIYSHLLVNKEAHQKGLNKIDLYWFVYIINETEAEFYFVDYNKVSQWKCKLMKYTDAYYNKILRIKNNE